MSYIARNLEKIRNKIIAAAEKTERSAEDITLVAVTKTRSIEEILKLKSLGVKLIGENRVQELARKFDYLKTNFNIHFIGHLQTNKVKHVVPMVNMIESVDSVRLACAIDKECKKIGKKMDVLMEVNTSHEEAKFGIEPENLLPLLKQASELKHIEILGLMTMAMFTDYQEKIKSCFRLLRELKTKAEKANIDNIHMRHLSMGMTNDFETAIEEGATIVRIGSAIFEKEP